MFHKILVPIDLADSALAAPAVEIAKNFAAASTGQVRLINVQSLMSVTFMDYVPPDFDASQKTAAETSLRNMAATLGLPDGRASLVVRTGGIYPEILDEAASWGADLIVVGSHRPAMSTYLLGSNAKTIVRHATCSVLVVRK